MLQKTTLLGYVGNEPKLRYTSAGTPVTSFSVATSKRLTDPSGHKIQTTTWWQVSAWNQLAEIIEKYGHKGQKVYIEGEIQADVNTGAPRLWTDKQTGQLRASFELKAFQVRFLSWKEDVPQQATHAGHYNGNGGNGNGGTPAPAAAPAPTPVRQPTRQPANDPANATTVPYRPPAWLPPAQQQRQSTPAQQQRQSTPAQQQRQSTPAQQRGPRPGTPTHQQLYVNAPTQNQVWNNDHFTPEEIPF